MARASGARLVLSLDALPFLSEAERLAEAGVVAGVSTRNRAGYGGSVELPEGLPLWRRDLLTDPQTSAVAGPAS